MSKQKRGLVLDLPGAPSFPHTVAPMPFWFTADEPVPVGDDQPISLEQAKQFDEDPGCPLKLVGAPEKAAARGEKEE